MNRRPSDEQLGLLLKTPHFDNKCELPPGDPITPTPMVLPIEQIKCYDHNPRRERNPLYDDIKDSIRAQGGLNNPLTVTRRPGDERYMVESGGNTRLQILNELFSETGDECFQQLHVLYRPWKSEFHVLTAHLIENDKRGDMLFIDKALAVRELKEMYEAFDDKTYSKRQLAQRLKEEGFSIDLAIISRMDYAIETLLPVIPEALRAGMGRPQIERIRRFEKAYLTYWTELSAQEEATFNELFQACLNENNRAEWDSDALRITTEERIASLLDIPMRSMRLDIDALLHGRSAEATQYRDVAPQNITTEAASTHDKHYSSNEALNEEPPDSNSEIATEVSLKSSEATSLAESSSDSPEISDSSNPGIHPDEAPSPSLTEFENSHDHHKHDESAISSAIAFDVAKARHNNFETAHELATRYQLEECIFSCSDWGLGFLVDLPGAPLIQGDVDDLEAKQYWQQTQRQWIWWLFYICSEETARPERIPNIPETMNIRGLCLEGNQSELMRLIGQPPWISMSEQLFTNPLLPDDDFHTIMALIRQCRQLRQYFGNDDALWMERNDYAPT